MTGASEQGAAATGSESWTADEAVAVAAPAPAIQVVSGWPTDEELAALIAVLTAASGGGDEPPEPTGSQWSAPSARLRSAYGPSRGGWRASGLPR